MGVPADTPGGTAYHFRDNRAQYFFSHPDQLVAAGGAAVVFSPGHNRQTRLTTDDGQFKRLYTAYTRQPAPLP
jgi:hypothetical protein